MGLHGNALCTMSWTALAELDLRAKAIARRGDISALKQFDQKRLALPGRECAERGWVTLIGDRTTTARPLAPPSQLNPRKLAGRLNLTDGTQLERVMHFGRRWVERRLDEALGGSLLPARFGSPCRRYSPPWPSRELGYAVATNRVTGAQRSVAAAGLRAMTMVERPAMGRTRSRILKTGVSAL